MSIKKVIFAGTPDFAVSPLQEIIKTFEVVGVFTQPDRASGRGKKIHKSAVKIFAEEQNLAIYQPEKINECVELIKDLNADIMVVVAFGQILPTTILTLPKFGCLNIHASLLPRWRGAAPIQRAILAGDKTTGVGIMQMDLGLDTGAILQEKTCEITNQDNAQTLHDKLAILGSVAIIEVLQNYQNLEPKTQIGEPIYAKKLQKSEAQIDLDNSIVEIDRKIRAFNPYPIAQITISSDKFEGRVLRILSAKIVPRRETKVYQDKENLIISDKENGLALEVVQLAGKKAVKIKDFNNAYKKLYLGGV